MLCRWFLCLDLGGSSTSRFCVQEQLGMVDCFVYPCISQFFHGGTYDLTTLLLGRIHSPRLGQFCSSSHVQDVFSVHSLLLYNVDAKQHRVCEWFGVALILLWLVSLVLSLLVSPVSLLHDFQIVRPISSQIPRISLPLHPTSLAPPSPPRLSQVLARLVCHPEDSEIPWRILPAALRFSPSPSFGLWGSDLPSKTFILASPNLFMCWRYLGAWDV